MKQDSIKKLKKIIKICIWLFMFPFLYYACNWGEFLELDGCMDHGEVWDYHEKRCRADCVLWREDLGCVHMDEEMLTLFEACAKRLPSCDSERLDVLFIEQCYRYKKAYTLDDGYCDFDFKLEDCGKLEGNWLYPPACDEQK